MPFFGIGMKTDLFKSCGHCWVFQICWHIECSTFTASSFRIWISSAEIPSLPPALFIVMLPKSHLTLPSRKSGSRWVLTPFWLSGSLRSFCMVFFFFCIVLPPLLNIFCFCYVCTISVLNCAHLCMKCSLGISNFLEISSPSHILYSSLSLHWSLRRASLSLWNCDSVTNMLSNFVFLKVFLRNTYKIYLFFRTSKCTW